jgi:hypothetical protein
MDAKPVSALVIEDLQRCPVWQYTDTEEVDETYVRPVKRLPVWSLTGRVVATKSALANGERRWALLGNVDLTNPRLTEHFISMSVENDGKWFMLARYHDAFYAQSGPQALSDFLGLSIDDVFPISYDVREHVKGSSAASVGTILKEPRERLTRAQIMAMAVSWRRPVQGRGLYRWKSPTLIRLVSSSFGARRYRPA